MAEAPKNRQGGNEVMTPSSRRSRDPHHDSIVPEGEVLAGNFVIGPVIGEGGMAIVYRALQKSLNRPVAIKVLHSRFARDAEFVARFEDEAGALASLQHPNIVNIIDRGHDGDRYFFIMELVEGVTLDRRIIDNTLTFNDWKNVVVACRDALEYVHKRGFVHRDIKPSNILLGGENLIKIGDFGIAHIVGGESPAGYTARALGTANYMAPEQINDPANVDHRADIYSLGVAFYKMFARALPVGNDYPMPSEANHDVPVAVDEVIRKSLMKDREDRYATVKEFCDMLLKALKEQTVSITSVLNYRSNSSANIALYTGADFRHTPKPVENPEDKKDKSTEHKPKVKKNKKGDTGTSYPALTSTSEILKAVTGQSISRQPNTTPKPVRGNTPAPEPKSKTKTATAVPGNTPRPAPLRNTPHPTSKRGSTPRPASSGATSSPATPRPRSTPRPTTSKKTPVPVGERRTSQTEVAAPRGQKIIAILATIIALMLVGAIIFVVFGGDKKPIIRPTHNTTTPGGEIPISEQRKKILEDVVREKLEAAEELEDAVNEAMQNGEEAIPSPEEIDNFEWSGPDPDLVENGS